MHKGRPQLRPPTRAELAAGGAGFIFGVALSVAGFGLIDSWLAWLQGLAFAIIGEGVLQAWRIRAWRIRQHFWRVFEKYQPRDSKKEPTQPQRRVDRVEDLKLLAEVIDLALRQVASSPPIVHILESVDTSHIKVFNMAVEYVRSGAAGANAHLKLYTMCALEAVKQLKFEPELAAVVYAIEGTSPLAAVIVNLMLDATATQSWLDRRQKAEVRARHLNLNKATIFAGDVKSIGSELERTAGLMRERPLEKDYYKMLLIAELTKMVRSMKAMEATSD